MKKLTTLTFVRQRLMFCVLAMVLLSPALATSSAEACSITASRVCGGSPCPKGQTCKKVSSIECKCVKKSAAVSRRASAVGECQEANATLAALLGSSSEEIRLQAALGLLNHGCDASHSVEASAGCLRPAQSQYAACSSSCQKNSPGLQECFDGCVDVFGAVLERCAEGANADARRNECGDCLADCAEGRYQCFLDCRQAEPWDPSCYDDCEDIDCDDECSDVC